MESIRDHLSLIRLNIFQMDVSVFQAAFNLFLFCTSLLQLNYLVVTFLFKRACFHVICRIGNMRQMSALFLNKPAGKNVWPEREI